MTLKTLIKILISAAMLFIVLRMAKLDQLESTFRHISVTYLLIVVVGYSAGQLLSSYKWSLIARAAGVETTYPSALRAYFIGMYLNCFGLGTVGGDVARGLLLAQGQNKKGEALTSVIADRLHGLAVLSGIGAVAAVCFGTLTLDRWLVMTLIGLGGGIAVGWFIGPPILLRILPKSNRYYGKLSALLDAFPRSPRLVFKITMVSIFFHLTQIALHRVMGLSVGVDIPWSVLLVVIPFVNILSTLPISWNGLGVREGSYKFFLVPAILTTEQAVAFGAMWLLAVTVSSAIGGIVAVVTKDFSQIEEAAAAETAKHEMLS